MFSIVPLHMPCVHQAFHPLFEIKVFFKIIVAMCAFRINEWMKKLTHNCTNSIMCIDSKHSAQLGQRYYKINGVNLILVFRRGLIEVHQILLLL
jgi:hypothetical protein